MYIAGLEVLRVTRDECLSSSRQETDVWVDKTAPNNGLATLDPILFTDFRTGRTFASQLGPKCSLMSLSDDDGESWLPSQGCGINAGVDHQSVGGGPFPAERSDRRHRLSRTPSTTARRTRPSPSAR